MSLSEIRQKIDALDDRLLALLNERAELAHEVGVEKRAKQVEIYAPEREEQVLRALAEKNRTLGGRLTEQAIRAIYREIMSASLALEKDLGIAYLGPVASETHEAARQKFGSSVRYLARPSIAAVFSAVTKGDADYGVVPGSTSLDGAVSDTLDMFVDSPLQICAQVVVPVQHHLFARALLTELRRVYLPSTIAAACRTWLHENAPQAELVELAESARAAEIAGAERGAGAVVNRLTAELHGLQPIALSIQEQAGHTARFLVLGPSPSPATGLDRTALMFSVHDGPGALYHALEPFHRRQLTLSKIESRPSVQESSEYYFFVDVEGHVSEETVRAALDDLAARCPRVKVLGTYPRQPDA